MAKKKDERRLDSTKQYIDALSEQHSRLNIVRVDLGYKKPHSENITLEDANKDLNRMFNNMRSKPTLFDSKIGFLIKREEGETKGPHAHITLLYNGQETQKGAYLVDEIGKYWNNDITQGRGSYHNCNRNKYKYKGVGMLNHADTEKREILDKYVASYIYKDEVTLNSEEKYYVDTVYNIEVEDYHTYFVGKDGIWVHNTDSCFTELVTVNPKVTVVRADTTRDEGICG